MKQLIFKGSATALVTPMRGDLSVDLSALGRLIDHQIENGTSALVVFGTTGEAPTLSDREKLEILEFALERTNKKVPVIAGTGSNNTAHAVELSRQAAKIGAGAVLLVTPYYNKTTQDGLVEHFCAIASAVDIPCVLYNVPSRTGIGVAAATYKRLSEQPNIVAVKEASGSLSDAAALMSACKEELAVYSGNDDVTVPMMSLGAQGVISVLSNILPAGVAAMTKACLGGDFKLAASLQLRYADVVSALFSDVNPIPVKHALNHLGLNVGRCRLPLSGMREQTRERLEGILIELTNDEYFVGF